MTGRSESLIRKLHDLDRERLLVARAAAVLQWDQETYMPDGAVNERADQLAILEGLVHERATDPRIGAALVDLGSSPDNPRGDESLPALERDFLKEMRRSYDNKTRLSRDLVQNMARDASISQSVWVKARKSNDFVLFAPHLEKMIGYARDCAECWGFSDHPYDGLLDQYEPGMTESSVSSVFKPLQERLVNLVARIASAPRPDTSFLDRGYPVAEQDSFARTVMMDLGFEAHRGRLDRSAHPFTTTLGGDDVRITTRYYPKNLFSGLFSVIHETGHALYELGFDSSLRGSILADGASMGVHESQSRLWENVVGRSLPFWQNYFPRLKAFFPDQLGSVALLDFYRAVNLVEPSLVRVEADEVTYSLHIILRFNLERRLMNNSLSVNDLPDAWNAEMEELFSLTPATDAEGVLQDVHWASGAIGYFPSYALGNLYGLHFWRKLRGDLPEIDDSIARGDFSPLLHWLRASVHLYGRRLTPAGLLSQGFGEELSAEPFISYLEEKYGALYSL